MRVFIRTLGCPKNTADTGHLLTGLARYGILSARSEDDADAVIINTCSFIRSAAEESLGEIFSAAGRNRRVIVTGCLTGRYGRSLERKMPEVEAFIPVSDPARFAEVLFGRRVPPRAGRGLRTLPVLTAPSTCYVKISEGCDRRCSFCTIPSIRGRMVSRPEAEIESEVRRRAESGVAEIVLVGQDLTAYGRDTGGDLPSLLRRLLKIKGRFVYRLLYLYPAGLTRELVDLVLSEERICSYFDIPFQHSSKKILALMKRSGDRSKLLRLIGRIRRADPDAALRATVMVGFPGEGKTEFADLKDFVERAEFDHLGVFKFSAEEGTAAFRLAGQPSLKVKEDREREIMTLQRGISAGRLSRFSGRVLDAWVDGRSESAGNVWICRNRFFAPEIDGAIWARSRKPLTPGRRIRVRITATDDYDLHGEVV